MKIRTIVCLCLLVGAMTVWAEPLRYFTQSIDAPKAKFEYGNNTPAGCYVQADDAKLYYEVYGKGGEPILILHGGGVGCALEMGAFIDRLAVSNKVIVMSSRGHGRSGIGTKPVTQAQKAADVKAVLDDAKVDSATLIGFSDGGYSAYDFAAAYPDRVKKMVAIGAGELVPGLRKVVIRLDAMEPFDPAYFEQQRGLMPEPERWQEFLDDFSRFYNECVYSKVLYAKITCPVLLVVGEKDGNAPLSTVLAAYQQLPNAQLAVIAGAPHPCFVTDFAVVWEQVNKFLRNGCKE